MSVLNQNLLTLDFWQDKVTCGTHTVPIGGLGCAAYNITDAMIGIRLFCRGAFPVRPASGAPG